MSWSAQPQDFAPGVKLMQRCWWDEFTGTADDLISAELLRRCELPSEASKSVRLVFDIEGKRITRFNQDFHVKEGYRQVCGARRGCLKVIRGISYEEGQLRLDQLRASMCEQQQLARRWPFPIVCGVPI